MSVDPETLAFYQTEAAAYAGWSKADALPRLLQSLVDTLPPGAAILDLGAGAGWAARHLRRLGFRVTALDPATALLEPLLAEDIAILPGGATDLADLSAYDAIWSNCALQHLPRADLPLALDRIRAALKPGGRLGLCLHEGQETLRDRLGRLYCHWSEAEMTELLRQRGFSIAGVSHGAGRGYDGRPITILQIEALLNDA